MKDYIKEKSKNPAFSLNNPRIINFKFDYDSRSLTLANDYGYVNIANKKSMKKIKKKTRQKMGKGTNPKTVTNPVAPLVVVIGGAAALF